MGCSSSKPSKDDENPISSSTANNNTNNADAEGQNRPSAKPPFEDDHNTRKLFLKEWKKTEKDLDHQLVVAAQERAEEEKEREDDSDPEMWDRIHQDQWENMYYGTELEPALKSGAIALLDARWLVNFALKSDQKVLPCRQQIPKQAYLSLDDIATDLVEGIQIIALSYMWLTPEHPDPKGTTLQLLARWCHKRLQASYDNYGTARWAIFWDWASLHQHPDPAQGVFRTSEESELFRQGLENLSGLYSHPQTHCYRVTEFPKDGYPTGYTVPENANAASYMDRGWPFVESCWSSMVKAHEKTFNISVDRLEFNQDRERNLDKVVLPPLTPEHMWQELQHKSFTNAKDDRPLVHRLYKEQFVLRFQQVDYLLFENSVWGDDQVVALAEILGEGYTPELIRLSLKGNAFGAKACQALAKAFETYMPPELKTLNLADNPMLDDTCVELLAPQLVPIIFVSFQNTHCGVGACRALVQAKAAAAKSEETTNNKLCELNLGFNKSIGNEGIEIMADMIVNDLEVLWLSGCHVGDKGCESLAQAANALDRRSCPLRELYLDHNPDISDNGLQQLQHLVKKCPKLEELVLPARLESKKRNKMLQSVALHEDFQVKFVDY